MDNDPAWSNLVLWLQSKGMNENLLVCSKRVPGAGRGLFVVKDVSPNTPLFTIPKSAHMNLKTLRPLYRSIKAAQTLTATQMISMHIFLHHPDIEEGKSSCDPVFGPYISIMPRCFDGHPLSWRIHARRNNENRGILQQFIPSSVNRAVDAAETRFWEDWKAVSDVLRTHSNVASSTRRSDISLSPFVAELHVTDFLLAWLNVNTRCVYSQIVTSPSDPDNMTLCPMLDLANHTSNSTFKPRISPIPTFFSPSDHDLRAGEEVYLRYGSHSNSMLFAEYGFIEARPENGGQADVQDIVERLFQQKGDLWKWVETTLIGTNYWGDWKLYEGPSPAHASYRLFPALRLLHLSPSSSHSTFEDSADLATWRKTLLGEVDIVSTENENLVWKTLENICTESIQHAGDQCKFLQREIQARRFTGSMKYATYAILGLWLEKKRVCEAVRQSIIQRELFS